MKKINLLIISVCFCFSNINHKVDSLVSIMTLDEKIKIVNKSFDSLWLELWGKQTGCKYRGESIMSKEKFSTLKVNNKLKNIINLRKTM